MRLARPLRRLCGSTGVGLLLASTWLVAAVPVRADDSPSLEYQVKAAFLLNFTKFVEWPATAFANEHAPLVICLLGEDPFGGALDQMVRGESMNGRKLMVQRIRHVPDPKTCQVLFMKNPDKDFPKVMPAGVLTVGEGESFFREGGVIAFVLENHRVRFDINQKAAETEQLTVSSRLLNIARSVER